MESCTFIFTFLSVDYVSKYDDSLDDKEVNVKDSKEGK